MTEPEIKIVQTFPFDKHTVHVFSDGKIYVDGVLLDFMRSARVARNKMRAAVADMDIALGVAELEALHNVPFTLVPEESRMVGAFLTRAAETVKEWSAIVDEFPSLDRLQAIEAQAERAHAR